MITQAHSEGRMETQGQVHGQGQGQGLYVDPFALSEDQRSAVRALFRRFGRPCPQADSFCFAGQGPNNVIRLKVMMDLFKLCLVKRLGFGGPREDIPLWGLTKTGEAIAYRLGRGHGQGR